MNWNRKDFFIPALLLHIQPNLLGSLWLKIALTSLSQALKDPTNQVLLVFSCISCASTGLSPVFPWFSWAGELPRWSQHSGCGLISWKFSQKYVWHMAQRILQQEPQFLFLQLFPPLQLFLSLQLLPHPQPFPTSPAVPVSPSVLTSPSSPSSPAAPISPALPASPAVPAAQTQLCPWPSCAQAAAGPPEVVSSPLVLSRSPVQPSHTRIYQSLVVGAFLFLSSSSLTKTSNNTWTGWAFPFPNPPQHGIFPSRWLNKWRSHRQPKILNERNIVKCWGKKSNVCASTSSIYAQLGKQRKRITNQASHSEDFWTECFSETSIMGLLGQNPFSNTHLYKPLLFQGEEHLLYNNNQMHKA